MAYSRVHTSALDTSKNSSLGEVKIVKIEAAEAEIS